MRTDLAEDVCWEICPKVGVKFHEYANLFPQIEGQAFRDLVEDVRAHGVREPIVFLNGAILDGRNRYLAAREAAIEYPRMEYVGDDPLGFVISKNLKRRHLNESQRAAVAAKLAKMPQGARTDLEHRANLHEVSVTQAAHMMHVSPRLVRDAKTVQRIGAPELIDAMEAGQVAATVAADIARLPLDEQIEIVKSVDPKAFNKVAKHVRAARQAEKKQRRQDREMSLTAKIKALPDTRFGVILADPEWDWQPYGSETGMDRAAANHYPVSSTDEIAARNVASIAADDCVLFLWATAPKLLDALRVMEAWGFEYKTHIVWFKKRNGDGRGTGYWFTGEHELLLVGTRGKPVAPAMGTQSRSVIEAPVGEHSAKPEAFLELIERYFPNIPKIELNRRGPAREGWSAWGNEVDDE